MDTFKLEQIQTLHIELTTHCNASCPQCNRNLFGGETNPLLPVQNLDPWQLVESLPEGFLANLRLMILCGSYGDPILHPEFLNFVKYVRQLSPECYFSIHTHGGLRSTDWWRDLGATLGEHGEVCFAFDGLEDTNHIYRRGVKWERAYNNALAFIQAGGRATWKFIVFKHNEHQIEEAKHRAHRDGFYKIDIKYTERFFDLLTAKPTHGFFIRDKQGNPTNQMLEPHSTHPAENSNIRGIEQAVEESGKNVVEVFEDIQPDCEAKNLSMVYITAEGLVLPCTAWYHTLYDFKWNRSDREPVKAPHKQIPNNEVQDLIDKHGYKNLNIKYSDFASIMNSNFWTDVERYMNAPSYEQGKLFICALTCGSQFCKKQKQISENLDGNKNYN